MKHRNYAVFTASKAQLEGRFDSRIGVGVGPVERLHEGRLLEYVLIGTFWSFGLALFFATLTFHLIS